jgi:hypothetical protein
MDSQAYLEQPNGASNCRAHSVVTEGCYCFNKRLCGRPVSRFVQHINAAGGQSNCLDAYTVRKTRGLDVS